VAEECVPLPGAAEARRAPRGRLPRARVWLKCVPGRWASFEVFRNTDSSSIWARPAEPRRCTRPAAARWYWQVTAPAAAAGGWTQRSAAMCEHREWIAFRFV